MFLGKERELVVNSTGSEIYSRTLLFVYDLLVLGISARCIWRCTAERGVTFYNKHVSSNHLDVGVGTGFFLDKCEFPAQMPRLVLLDLNPNCLAVAAARLKRYRPQTYVANVLEPISINVEKFDSIGLSLVLHCLPLPIRQKAKAFKNLRALLRPGGLVLGSTILGKGVPRGAATIALTRFYNARRIFNNLDDDPEGLERILKESFDQYTLHVEGCVAFFTGRAS